MKKATSQYAVAAWLPLLLALLNPHIAFGQTVEISEFMTSGGSGVIDEDGDESDWIEVHNAGSAPVDLAGWGLSDEPAVPLKWQFPSVVLQPDAYVLVFASGKDRRTLGNTWDTVVRASDTWQYTTTAPAATWTQPSFDDASWSTGPGGIGYGPNEHATTVPNGTLGTYVRTRFTIDDPAQVTRGLLHVTWDDGFAAYLNGTEIARANCCASPDVGNAGPLAPFNIANVQSLLLPGENVLALEVHNTSANS
ncbi:MAG TPA: lamin tail domain-containing protein, partial [Rhodothermales bacterium]